MSKLSNRILKLKFISALSVGMDNVALCLTVRKEIKNAEG